MGGKIIHYYKQTLVKLLRKWGNYTRYWTNYYDNINLCFGLGIIYVIQSTNLYSLKLFLYYKSSFPLMFQSFEEDFVFQNRSIYTLLLHEVLCLCIIWQTDGDVWKLMAWCLKCFEFSMGYSRKRRRPRYLFVIFVFIIQFIQTYLPGIYY